MSLSLSLLSPFCLFLCLSSSGVRARDVGFRVAGGRLEVKAALPREEGETARDETLLDEAVS